MNNQSANPDTEFIKRVHVALYTFQMIEEALKVVVGLSYEIIQATAPAPISFTFQPSELNDAALGTLRKLYGRVSKNQATMTRLSEIASWRDYCAHRAFHIEFMSRTNEKYEAQKDGEGLAVVTRAALHLLEDFGREFTALQGTYAVVKEAQTPRADA